MLNVIFENEIRLVRFVIAIKWSDYLGVNQNITEKASVALSFVLLHLYALDSN
jgi:hypothetical protein